MRANRVFCKSTHSCFRSSVLNRKGQSISRVRIFSSENECSPFHGGNHPPYPTCEQMTVSYSVCILGAQGWSLLWTVWELTNACSQSSAVEQMSVLLSSCIVSLFAPMPTSSQAPCVRIVVTWLGKGADWCSQDESSCPRYPNIFCWCFYLWAFTMGTNIITICAHLKKSTAILFP